LQNYLRRKGMDDSEVERDAGMEERVRQVIARAFGLSSQESRGDLRMGGLPRWDSMGHMQLIIEIEKEFGLTFPTYEIAELLSTDAIIKAVEKYGEK
jgi:acyl carrier protein